MWLLITNLVWLWLAGPHLWSANIAPRAHPALLNERYGPELRNAVVHHGDTARLKSALRRARAGGRLNIGVLGGSVSEGAKVPGFRLDRRGALGLPGRPSERYPDRFMRAFNARFPVVGGGHVLANGAVGATGSNYFAFCAQHHLERQVDIVFLEHALNDAGSNEGQTAAHFEAELRKVLAWNTRSGGSNPPAVIVLEVRSLLASHLLAALYYDVPVLSAVTGGWAAKSGRFMAQPHMASDGIHPDADGHLVISDIMVAFVDAVLAEVDAAGPADYGSREPHASHAATATVNVTLPAPMTTGDWGPTKQGCDAATDVLCDAARQANSLCFTTTRPRPSGLVKAARAAVGLDPGKVTPQSTLDASDYSFENEALTLNKNSSGWEYSVNHIPVPGVFVEDRAKVGFEPTMSGHASDAADTVSLRVKVEPHAHSVVLLYLRSARYDLGIASCWVAGLGHAPVKVHGHWNKSASIAQAMTLDDAVPPGEQAVECKMLQGPAERTGFRIIAVFTL